MPVSQPPPGARRRLRKKTAPGADGWAEEAVHRSAGGNTAAVSPTRAAKKFKSCTKLEDPSCSGTAATSSESAARAPAASAAASAPSATGGVPACGAAQQALANASQVALACTPVACVVGSPCEGTRSCPGSAGTAISLSAPRSVEGGGGLGPCGSDSPGATGAGGKGSARACEARESGGTVSSLALCPRQPDGSSIKLIGGPSLARPHS